uniref:hypothetical protein n=1 Tax=Myroides sp. DW712 TaxID=3389800 RepID=UPI00397A1109
SFTLVNDRLVVTDSAGNAVSLAVEEIANNSTFVTNLVENQEFITKLGDNIDFVNHITNNNEFIENIINKLKGKYGNVFYNGDTNKFYYLDDQGNLQDIDWGALNTVNVSFTLENDFLVVTDSAGDTVSLAVEEIANNSTFVTNLVENQEFITKLGDNIDFVNQITNNNEFIEKIINKLKGEYGNVFYNGDTNKFYYLDDQGNPQDIDWGALNTVNVSFTLENDFLVVTDSAGDTVSLAVEEIAKNSKFVTNLVENQEFITKLGDNIDFVNQITNNNDFIEKIINKLKGEYGNVFYNGDTNKFYYLDDQGNPQDIDWGALNTVNVSFTLVNDRLVVTDSAGNAVSLAVEEIAKNSKFVTNLVENQEFITKLGDNIDFVNQITNNNEFIEKIINKLKGEYGNVFYNGDTNKFYYLDDQGNPQDIDWGALNTVNVSFTLVNDRLVVTDSAGNAVSLAVEEIANNSKFVTNLVENQEFITKLGDNIDFVNQITNNNEFIEKIINKLKGEYGNVFYNGDTNKFYYLDDQGNPQDIDWGALNTVNVSFTLENDFLVVTDSAGDTVSLAVEEIAKNSKFVTNLVENQEFITKLGDNIDFVNQITNNNDFIEKIINKLKGEYGNVFYNGDTNKFYYLDDQGNPQDIDWGALNTVNVSFTLENDFLVVTDSAGDTVSLAVEEIAKNSKFVTNLVENQEFITKLGDNIDFVNQITNNNEFIEKIINKLKGEYGNVFYNGDTNKFYYLDDQGNPQDIDWSTLNTVNKSFTIEGDYLVITDSSNNKVQLALSALVSHPTFVAEIINKLRGKYGNVYYDASTNKYYYIQEDGTKVEVDPTEGIQASPWMVQGTTNVANANTQNIYQTGTVAIGASVIPASETTAKLYVAGDVVTSGKYFTTNSVYADYVFEKYFTGSSDIKLTYEFNSLNDVATFVKENHHLPGVTPIADLSKNERGYGFDLTNLSVELLEKVEELFLHTIEQQDQIEKLMEEQERATKSALETRKRLEKVEEILREMCQDK